MKLMPVTKSSSTAVSQTRGRPVFFMEKCIVLPRPDANGFDGR